MFAGSARIDPANIGMGRQVMRGNVRFLVFCFLVAIGLVLCAPDALAQAPKSGQDGAKAAADSADAPEQLRGRSVIIGYNETRTARSEGGGPAETRTVFFRMIIYVSTEKRAFNRLVVGRAGASDQVRAGKNAKATEASKDVTQFAERDVVFDGLNLKITNNYGAPSKGGKGRRDISATFDENYAKCTANVVTTIDGEFVRRRQMKGGFEELLSAKHHDITCKLEDGNALTGA
jgi:hypothetical protein